MIETMHLSGKKLSSGMKKTRGEQWMFCFAPKSSELKEIAEHTGIPYEDMLRSLDEDERPGLTSFDEYSVITFHAPYFNKTHKTVPFNIFIKENMLIFLYSKHVEAIEKFKKIEDQKKVEILQKDVTFSIYMVLNEVINHFYKVSDEIEDKIDDIEQMVFAKPDEKIVQDIFSLKKTLIYFHKSLTGNREVISGIETRFIKEVKGKNIKMFRFLYNDVIQLIDMVATYRDIMTSSLDIYLSSVSNNLNEVMKRLTIITSFILIPSLIAGIYGMNFKYMPEIHGMKEYGYPFALLLMVVSVVFVYYYFKKKKWI